MNPDILNAILGCLGSLLFCLGWVWLNKTEDDEVLASHINDLQTKKVDTDWKDYKARAYLSAQQSNIVDATATKVLLNAETYDPGGNFDADGVDSEFIAPISAYYLIHGQITWINVVVAKRYRACINIEGVQKARAISQSSMANHISAVVTDVLYVAAGESIDLRAYHQAGVDTPDIEGGQDSTYLTIHILSI